jgi:hypothetical protein
VPSSWFSLVVECEDPWALASFWCEVLGYEVVSDWTDVVGISPHAAAHPGIEFVRSPGPRTEKSPLHLDLNPDDQASEVARLLALGARHVDVGQPGDASWVVLADPEGNAFCVLASQRTWSDSPE